jgi:predicted HicB family RNase H-like nuclease
MGGDVKYMTNKARFTFRIPSRLFEAVKRDAKDKGVSINALILEILWQRLEKQQTDESPRGGQEK